MICMCFHDGIGYYSVEILTWVMNHGLFPFGLILSTEFLFYDPYDVLNYSWKDLISKLRISSPHDLLFLFLIFAVFYQVFQFETNGRI